MLLYKILVVIMLSSIIIKTIIDIINVPNIKPEDLNSVTDFFQYDTKRKSSQSNSK